MTNSDQTNAAPPERRKMRWEPHDIAPLITFAVLLLFFSVASRDFLGSGTVMLVLQQGAVLAIVSVGLTFVLLCGEIDLSVGMVALWTACICGVLFKQPLEAGSGTGSAVAAREITLLVFAIPLLTSLVFGVVSGILTVASRLPSFIITLSMMNIADGLARYLTRSKAYDIPDVLKKIGNAGIPLGGRIVPPYSALVAAGIMLAGHLVLRHTRFGRYVYMTGGNREAARLAGVRTYWIVIASLALCAVTAGLGGLVNAGRLGSISLDQNRDLLLNAVACVVLGGTSLFGGEGGIGRTFMGVLTFSMLQVGLNQITWIHDLMRPFLMGVVLMVALVINGLLARRRRAG